MPTPTEPKPKRASRAKAKPQDQPAAPATNGNGTQPEQPQDQVRSMLAIPHVEKGQKINHAAVVSEETLRLADAMDATRAARAAELWGDQDTLTGALLRKLQPLLREPINPRNIVTTGPAEKGKPYVSTGIQSVQVQLDRLAEVLGLDHYRTLAWWTPTGERCHVHVVIGNDLQWCHVDDRGELLPYTLLPNTLGGQGWAHVAAGVEHADVLAHSHGWGGHARGSAPGDIWKGSYTNAAKLAIARVGPGDHVYRLEFEDDPHDAEPRRPQPQPQPQQPPAPAGGEQGQLVADEDPAVTLQALLDEPSPLQALRKDAAKGMTLFGASPRKQLASLRAANTEGDLRELIQKVQDAMDAAAAQGE